MPEPSNLVLGCIADDHTGATDLAGLLARSGMRVSLRLGVPDVDPDPSEVAPFEVIALKSRNLPVAEAVAEALKAMAWLKAAGAHRFFWKYCSTFDSTSEGNIGPVAEALMAELGIEQTIYCPSFPENGRSVYMGNLFVGDVPISESPMRDHPLTPMRDSNLMRLLEAQTAGRVGLANWGSVAEGPDALRSRLAELKTNSVAHVVVDAISNDDLATIAQACHLMPLITGGSAIAMPLPEIYRCAGFVPAGTQNFTLPRLPKGRVVLSGSCSQMTRKQVAAYLQTATGYRLDPIELAKGGLCDARKWLAGQKANSDKIIYATAEPEQVCKAQEVLGTETASQLIENALGVLAVDARNQGICRFVVAGGETSGAITQALGVSQLSVLGEIVPGVPWTYCISDGVRIALALKSGNFGTEDFFHCAFEKLETP